MINGPHPTSVLAQEEGAALCLQRRWRSRMVVKVPLTSIEKGWHGAWARRHGPLDSHVRYLQWLFRATTRLRRGCWARGKLRTASSVACSLRKSLVATRCQGGDALASESEFVEQRQRAEDMLDWYATYVTLLRRLESGVTPFCLQNFVGGGGSSEGCRRAGGATFINAFTLFVSA